MPPFPCRSRLPLPSASFPMSSMASQAPVPFEDEPADAALQQVPWRMAARLSSVADGAEALLSGAGFDRGPWLAVALAAGIAAWFVLPSPVWWVAAMAGGVVVALGTLATWR